MATLDGRGRRDVAGARRADAEGARRRGARLPHDEVSRREPVHGGGRALSATEWLKQVKARVDHRLDNRPELRVELLNFIGSSLVSLQDTASAGAVLSQAVDESTRRLGPTHPETLHARVLQTLVYRFSGARTRSEGSWTAAAAAARTSFLRARASLVIALKNLAHLELDGGRYAQAERAAQEAIAVASGRLGERHPETVAAFLMVALTYYYNRNPDIALQASERAGDTVAVT